MLIALKLRAVISILTIKWNFDISITRGEAFFQLFRDGWSGYLGILLLIAGLYVLYKHREIVYNSRFWTGLIVVLFALGALMLLINDLYYSIRLLSDPSFFFQIFFDKLIGRYGWSYHVSMIIIIGAVIYFYLLYRGKKQPKGEKTIVEEQRQLSVWEWFWTVFLLGIPVVSFILLLVWGFGAPNPRKNFSLAMLLFQVIGLILGVLVFIIIFIAGASAYNY